MPTRRSSLKTLAGATVVGSLSGCVQLATQRTTHFHGTPAMLQKYVPNQDREGTSSAAFASTVGIEAHKTVERFGITKEIVTHNWGMLYTSISGRSWTGDTGGQWSVGTFTTPSIKIAGKELNPIKDLTVRGIGNEFLSAVDCCIRKRPGRTKYSNISMAQVDDATGKKVLRAFRGAIGGGSVYEDGNIEHTEIWESEQEKTVPDWDGDSYSATFQPDRVDDSVRPKASVRFDKHDGDFVILFAMGPEDTEVSTTVTATFYDTSGNLIPDAHPPDDEFNQEMLRRHLIETNLHGSLGLVKQSRKLIGETQDLLAQVKNDTRNEEDDRFIVITDTQDDLERLDTILGGLGEDLQSLTGGTGDDTLTGGTLDRLRERAKKAAAIATRAHDRVASYNNDTRDEEDDRFVAIERNLNGLKSAAVTVVVVYDEMKRASP